MAVCNYCPILGTIRKYLTVYYVRCMVSVALITRPIEVDILKKSDVDKLQQILRGEQ